MLKTFKIQIGGQVQGVGFRPFVFNLANRYGLQGTVSNDGKGVLIYANGQKNTVVKFREDILEKAPDTAIIQSDSMVEVAPMEFDGFRIVSPLKKQKVAIPLTADFAICSSCKKEVQDPGNRRFRYAFTTCTQCGPRYAITQRFPFERENTSMTKFKMCQECSEEYQNPENRRFHSQTNSCADCGMQLKLVDAAGESVVLEEVTEIQQLSRFLLNGAIVAIKSTNGYLLCADARNEKTIRELRKRKQRPAKPFALLYKTLEEVQNDFDCTPQEKKALCSKTGPIVVLSPKANARKKIAGAVAPGLDRLGVMLPASAVLSLLAGEVKIPLVATSGNIHGSPILSDEKEAQEKLQAVADYFLHHNLDISFPQDDSVWQFIGAQRLLLRRSRGMAPNFMGYRPTDQKRVLAMGAHLKSTLAFVPNGHTYLSPYFGNLDTYEVLQRYRDTLQGYIQIFEALPELIIVDSHPSYQSTLLGKELARKWQIPVVAVQHHKAHFASVLAEHNLFGAKAPVLGVVWDGTGFGDDEMIWGGEFFMYNENQIERLDHFAYFDVLAGDKMAQEPRLSLLSLVDADTEIQNKFSTSEWKIYQKLKTKQGLKTSSVGRVFDAMTALLGLLEVSSYEGEAAMLLESLAWQYGDGTLMDFLEGVSYTNIPTQKIIAIAQELKQDGQIASFIAASFVFTLAKTIIRMALEHNIKQVACSGGVFQNRLLVKNLIDLADKVGLECFFNTAVSSNDENIALGQLTYYQNIKEETCV
ncbi:MAG: carbamoyltransferase HypF [Bacteroidota bacterium]